MKKKELNINEKQKLLDMTNERLRGIEERISNAPRASEELVKEAEELKAIRAKLVI